MPEYAAQCVRAAMPEALAMGRTAPRKLYPSATGTSMSCSAGLLNRATASSDGRRMRNAFTGPCCTPAAPDGGDVVIAIASL